MEITLRYIAQFIGLQDAKLLAGSEGLDRIVRGCDILDYELDRSLNGKYSYSNFNAERLVLTSFQSAKDDPYLIDEAVKHCIAANASGLVIRNVYQLPIHDYTLRYADSKKFPIYLLENRKSFFEDIIVQVDRCVAHAAYAAVAEANLTNLLFSTPGREEKERLIAQVFPAFFQTYELCYLRSPVPFSEEQLQTLYRVSAQQASDEEACAVLPYRGSAFLFRSADRLADWDPFQDDLPDCSVGISRAHHFPMEIDRALREAMDAATVCAMQKEEHGRPKRYDEIGIYRALLPLRMEEVLHDYARDVFEPLMEFDAENRSELLSTVLELVRCGGDLHLLAEKRGEHENTLRNRLDKVRNLTGLSYRKSAQYEELALAARVMMLEQAEIE